MHIIQSYGHISINDIKTKQKMMMNGPSPLDVMEVSPSTQMNSIQTMGSRLNP